MPELPEDDRARVQREIVTGRGAMTPDGARRLLEVTLRHPGVTIVVSALGAPPPDVVARLRESRVMIGALCGKASHAVRQRDAGVELTAGFRRDPPLDPATIGEDEALAARIRARCQAADWSDPKRPPFHGFLLSGHGLYTWGRDLAEARRQIEIHEFLFEVVARTRTFAGAGATSPIAPAAAVTPQPVQTVGGREGGSILRQQQTSQQ